MQKWVYYLWLLEKISFEIIIYVFWRFKMKLYFFFFLNVALILFKSIIKYIIINTIIISNLIIIKQKSKNRFILKENKYIIITDTN